MRKESDLDPNWDEFQGVPVLSYAVVLYNVLYTIQLSRTATVPIFKPVRQCCWAGGVEIILRIRSQSRNDLFNNIDCAKVRLEAGRMNKKKLISTTIETKVPVFLIQLINYVTTVTGQYIIKWQYRAGNWAGSEAKIRKKVTAEIK